MRPRIGVTTSRRTGWRVFPVIALNVWLAGGRALRWDSGRDADIDAADGLIVGGGDDISPLLYHGEMVAEARLDPDRDALERRLVMAAQAAGKPVLGICRGAQMLNVALGGNLHQRAYDHYADSRRYRTILPRKAVSVLPDTGLARIAGTAPMRVNALHSQAVDRLGAGLRIAARDAGGMVQAVERITPPFALGVQWHPEYLIYARRQRALFRALVAAARV
ncbi:type 1 glutamine amidotransferase [Seohaeicola sp. SP36]|uniref:gamma-glutamyl-gamma-aminobutyrate hydrolase family protein n=1 Tax=unclassified Seohaeicola TaxID=2641111 RepID=UPI00237C1BF9|nr:MULTISPECIES: type 1 glutamine amidotransferase [unclassified Seohaeicola]MDD9707420.1 type 1 glutamine amidotransferase [Seohaeicola sp. 4SK31]MDD9735605.1 type 1 glutamine amidotransferase [Seohaeicola sp. SP36]